MSVTSVQKDTDAMTMTITSEFDAPIEKVWQLWENPRLLERWWGPPTYPATFVEHDLTPGGAVTYFMTGPEGDTHGGWWKVVTVEPGRSLEFDDGFAGDDGKPNLDMPVMRLRVTLSEQPACTRMVIETTFPSREAMDEMITMGMDEGMSEALGQIDAILREEATAR